jgi:hypothetical protein
MIGGYIRQVLAANVQVGMHCATFVCFSGHVIGRAISVRRVRVDARTTLGLEEARACIPLRPGIRQALRVAHARIAAITIGCSHQPHQIIATILDVVFNCHAERVNVALGINIDEGGFAYFILFPDARQHFARR